MSEFVKSNTMSLRAMILGYQAEKIPFFEAYHDFLDIVGADVISYEEFEFWYQRFEQGLFDLSHERKSDSEMSKQFIKSDPISLRACVLYHVDKNKPIFETFKEFSKVIGIETMSYPEYEFWYRRFQNGLFDLTYDTSLEPKHPEFLKLPIDTLEMIVKMLNLKDIHSLRHSCHHLKLIAEGASFKLNHGILHLLGSYMSLKIDDKYVARQVYYDEDDDFEEEVSCEHFVKTINEIETHLKPRKIEFEKFQLDVFVSNYPCLEQIFPLITRVGSLVTKLRLNVPDDKYLETLKCFQPGKLERIELWNMGNDEIYKTEQWKQAKFMRSIFDSRCTVEDFGHFEEFSVGVRDLQDGFLAKWKTAILNSTHFRKCQFILKNNKELTPEQLLDKLARELGSDAVPIVMQLQNRKYAIEKNGRKFEIEMETNRITIERMN